MFHQEKMTDPFTGVEFTATFHNDNSVSMSNPLTGASYNFKIYGNSITIPLSLFDRIAIYTPQEAAKILGVSRQRISKMAIDEVIPSYTIAGTRVFKAADVIRYKHERQQTEGK